MTITQSEIHIKLLKLARRFNKLNGWKNRLFEQDNLISRQKLKTEIVMLKRKLNEIEERIKGGSTE